MYMLVDYNIKLKFEWCRGKTILGSFFFGTRKNVCLYLNLKVY